MCEIFPIRPVDNHFSTIYWVKNVSRSGTPPSANSELYTKMIPGTYQEETLRNY